MTAFPVEAEPFVLWENAFFNLALLVWCLVFFGIGFYMAQREFSRRRAQGLKLAVKAMLKDYITAFESHPNQMKPMLDAFYKAQTKRLGAIEKLGMMVAKGSSSLSKASRQTVKVQTEGGQGALNSGAVNGGTVINLVVNQPQTINQCSSGTVEATSIPMASAPIIGAQPMNLSVNPIFPEDSNSRLFHEASRYNDLLQDGKFIKVLLDIEEQLFRAKPSGRRVLPGETYLAKASRSTDRDKTAEVKRADT